MATKMMRTGLKGLQGRFYPLFDKDRTRLAVGKAFWEPWE